MISRETLGLVLLIIFVPQLVCSVNADNNLYSGNKYTCNAEYNENYMYKWSASSGSHQENDKSTFVWTAPDVNSPTEVAISVLVTDKRCGCHSNFEKMFIVIPREETKLDIKSVYNSTNSTQISDNTGQTLIPSNNTENLTAAISIGNDTKPETASESPENVIKSINQKSNEISGTNSGNDSYQVIAPVNRENATQTDLISGSNSVMNTENDSANIATRYDILSTIDANPSPAIEGPEEASDQNNQAATAENPLTIEAQNDQSLADETRTLSFGDGVEVDVVFEQSNSLADTAYVIIQEAVKEVIGSGSSSDGTNTPASLTNTTIVPESRIDQSDANINQTKAANALPEIGAGSTGKTDETPEQLNSLDVGSEVAVALPDPNENHPEQAINQTTSE